MPFLANRCAAYQPVLPGATASTSVVVSWSIYSDCRDTRRRKVFRAWLSRLRLPYHPFTERVCRIKRSCWHEVVAAQKDLKMDTLPAPLKGFASCAGAGFIPSPRLKFMGFYVYQYVFHMMGFLQ